MFHLLRVMACVGAAAGWSVTHRQRHMHADRTGDPHQAKALGWWALVVGSYESEEDKGAGLVELRRKRFATWLYLRYLMLAPFESALPRNLLYRASGWYRDPNALRVDITSGHYPCKHPSTGARKSMYNAQRN